MPKFLKTSGVSHHLENIISNAKSKLYLVSPYLQINSQLRLLLEDTTNRFIKTHIIYGKKKESNSDDLNWINSHPRIRLNYYESLHAKCYLNEKEVIITSMNLYMYSQQNNCEMGVLVTLKDDEELYNEILTETERIIRQSEEVQKQKKTYKVEHNPIQSWLEQKTKTKTKSHYGFCIRTGVEIPFNPDSPLSFKAFESWAKFRDECYPEMYCHYSGEKSNGETSYGKPILRKNWKEAQKIFNL